MNPKTKKGRESKERNSEGGFNMSLLKRQFQEKYGSSNKPTETKEKKIAKKKPESEKHKSTKDIEKSQAKREISRLKAQQKKGGIAHKENIEHGIKTRKEKHGIK